jgi:hypothetical protein
MSVFIGSDHERKKGVIYIECLKIMVILVLFI